MSTLSQPQTTAPVQLFPALAAAFDALRPAQGRAIMAWHYAMPLSATDRACAGNPRFPLIVCDAAPVSGEPEPRVAA